MAACVPQETVVFSVYRGFRGAMKAIVLTILFAAGISAANQNQLQFAPNSLAQNYKTPMLAGTIYSSQPGTQVTLTLPNNLWFFATPSNCNSASPIVVTAPAAIYVCAEDDGYPPLTMTATAAGFPSAEIYIPASLFTVASTITVAPSLVDLSQGTQVINVSLAANISTSDNVSPNGVTVSYFSSNDPNWLNLSRDCYLEQTCTLSTNSPGLVPGQQYAAYVTFNTTQPGTPPPLQNSTFAETSTTLMVTYTYGGANLAITSALVFQYDQFQPVNGTLAASGGVAPYTWSATGLPAGIALSSAGVISGVIGSMNTFTPQITLQDSAGNILSEYLTITPGSITFTPASLTCSDGISAAACIEDSPPPIPPGAFLVGYLSSSPYGIPVTLTPLFSSVSFTVSGSGYCPSSAAPVTVSTVTPIFICTLDSLPFKATNFSFTAAEAGFAPRVFAVSMDVVEGSGASLNITPQIANVSGQGVQISALAGSGDYVQQMAVTYSSGPNSGWVHTNFAAVESGCESSPGTPCVFTVSADFSGSTPPAAGTPYSAGIHVTTFNGAAQWLTVQYAYSPTQAPLRFIPVTPCRVVDTRNPNGAFGGPLLAAKVSRDFAIPAGSCNIPATAQAFSLNVTVVPSGSLSYVTVWPSGQTQPTASTLNSLDGRIKANAAIIPAGTNGAISVYATNNTQLVLDIDGYFVPENNSSALAFYPLTPCRVVDTRNPDGPLGGPFIGTKTSRDFPIVSSSCSVPANAAAYSLNLTSVPKNGQPLIYLTAWPTGQTQPTASVLNAPTGVITANGAIIPAGADGDISVYASNDTDVVIDINGYFAAPGTGGLALYNLTPCRVLDSRAGGSPPLQEKQTLRVPIAGSCGVPDNASAYVFNATAVPPGQLVYLTLWPDPGPMPVVSTLNAVDGAITSNLAIVPVNNGSIDAYVSNPSHLVLDIFGYFAQ